MTGWAFVAVIAILVWGVVQLAKARAGITTDAKGNETFVPREPSPELQERAEAEAKETRREIEALRERLHVLERIATDANSPDMRRREQIAAEIEALRGGGVALPGQEAETTSDYTSGKEPNP